MRSLAHAVRTVALGTALAVAHAPLPADAKKKSAKSVDRETKRALRFDKEGKKFYRAKRYEDAIAAFEAGYEIKALPRLLFNIGRCHEKLGDLDKAVDHFERYRHVAKSDEDIEDAETALGIVRVKLKKSRSWVRIQSNPSGARLRLEARSGTVIDATTPYAAWLPFEWYRAQAYLEGRDLATKEFQVMEDQEVELELKLRKPVPPPPPPVAAAPAPTPTPVPAPTQPTAVIPGEIHASPAAEPEPEPAPPARVTAWIALGTAVALAGGAVYFGFGSTQEWIARDQLREERTNLDDIIRHDEAAHSNALIANILWGATAAVLGAAAITW